MKLKKLLKDGLIITAVTLAMFASAEMVLRIAFPDKVPKEEKPDPKDYAYQFNKDYLLEMKPGIVKNIPGGVSWRTNKDSFRGEELEQDPDIRIMVYGDSNLQARFSRLEDTYPHRLEEYLKKSLGRDIEVINAGLIGTGPDQNYIRFSKEVGRYKPDIVVFHIFADNDYGDILRNRLFELDTDENLVRTGFETTPDKLLKTAPDLKERVRDFASSLLLVRSVKKLTGRSKPEEAPEKKTVNINDMYMSVLENVEDSQLIDQYATVLKGEYDVYKKKQPRFFSHFADHYDLDVAAYPESESSKVKIKLMEEILKKGHALAEAHGVKFIVLIQPSVIDSTENFIISYKDVQERYPEYKRTNLTGKLERICSSNNILYINLYDVFQNNRPGELFFKCCNNHWNNTGQDVAARETSSYITRNILRD